MNRTAILIYDMQAGIAHRLPNAAPVIARARETLAQARAAKVPVFFCRHLTWPKAVSGPAHLKSGMALARATDVSTYVPQFLRESPGFPIIDELAPTPDEGVFDKIGMAAFDGTPLDAALRDLGVTHLIVLGAVLEIGVIPTAQAGLSLGYEITLVSDACYTFLPSTEARDRVPEGARWVPAGELSLVSE